jgi:hypothetical protein
MNLTQDGPKQSEYMQKFQLPYITLPIELIKILKTNLSVSNPSQVIAEILQESTSIHFILQKPFLEFGFGSNLERSISSMGWQNFRDRLTGLYIHKSLYGDYPLKATVDQVLDIKNLEDIFSDHYVKGPSRIFMLGFYLRLVNIYLRNHSSTEYNDIRIPQEVINILSLSKNKSHKIDWLILILMHLNMGLGYKNLSEEISYGKKIKDLYVLLTAEQRKLMLDNLLAYGASIGEADLFLYDKI